MTVKVRPAARRIFTSQKTFANHLADKILLLPLMAVVRPRCRAAVINSQAPQTAPSVSTKVGKASSKDSIILPSKHGSTEVNRQSVSKSATLLVVSSSAIGAEVVLPAATPLKGPLHATYLPPLPSDAVPRLSHDGTLNALCRVARGAAHIGC